ncbi:MAG: hypothetical protein KAW12_02470 [Candidatus Aminicenantes bacterium]|nr:hypothetical protein [Candidatus Aminicenantes bacterium]
MGNFIRLLCLSLLIAALPNVLQAAASIHCKGDYFLYSDEKSYIYGAGNITLKSADVLIKGDVLYLDVNSLRGVVYGAVSVKKGKEKKTCQALFFTAFPIKLLYETFSDKVIKEGSKELNDILKKYAPKELKNLELYFEFREFRIDKYKKIKAKTIIPYIVGLPTVPIKSFTIKRGNTPEKTMVYFKNLNVFGLEGLAVTFLLRLRGKFIKGDFDVKLYEKKLLGIDDGSKRGILFSGSSDLLAKKKSFLNFSTLLNTGDKSYNLSFNHRRDFKHFNYSLSQTVSGREKMPAFFQFVSNFTVKKILFLGPTFSFTHNLKQSYSYGVSTPVYLLKKVGLNMSWSRKIIKENYNSDTEDFSTSMNFNTSIAAFSTNYNFSKNMLDAAIRQNFSANVRLSTLNFLDKNVTIDLSTFYMFSAIPSGRESINRTSPGVNGVMASKGALLPFGFTLAPSFSFNHIWDSSEENFTDFNYQLALEKKMGKFKASLAYALASRYRSKNFYVEGSNTQNLNVNLELINPARYSFYLRFYWNNELALENISLSGKVNLPAGFVFSTLALYYKDGSRLQTLELFLEKKIMHNAKLQGGYSLALKRFFVKVVSF